MASDQENDYHSDEDINTGQHSRFLEDVFQLDKKQFVKKPTRTEPTTHVSEFNLVKNSSARQNIVNISELTKSLEKKKKHAEVSAKIKSTQKKVGTLRQPLEKPQRERIKRSVGFKEVKLDLGKWDPIVTKNRVTSQLQFPLNEGDLHIYKGKRPAFQLKFKSKLEEELDKLEPIVEEEEKPIDTFPLTMKEILEKRREMARLRAQQSYQEAKYHRQNKIKSKKFHRIQRKEKVKDQIKDFEKLQKTDPEEALRKLEEIERARAEERMSLRHRSTGQWAKNKLVRAKYDKETRQILAKQLSISRELTQKLKADSSSESEDEAIKSSKSSDPSNPWMNSTKSEQEINDFVSGYRKFWKENNKTVKEAKISEENGTNADKESADNEENNISIENSDNIEEFKEKEPSVKSKVGKKSKKKVVDQEKEARLLKKLQSMDLSTLLGEKLSSSKKRKKPQLNLSSTSDWDVEESINEDHVQEEDIEDMFEDLESINKKKLKNKLTTMRTDLDKDVLKTQKENKQKKNKKQQKNDKKNSKTTNYMELPREKYRPEIDEELTMEDNVENPLRKISKLSSAPTQSSTTKKGVENPPQNADIDPNKYMNIKPTQLDTFLPNSVDMGDDNQSDEEGGASEAGEDQKDIITEAFAGDDVVSDFVKEKKDIVDGEVPNDIDLTLPGWGSWGGTHIKPSKRKRRRFIVKFPKKMPRRDENKGQVIINESKNEKLHEHLVSELPFPFRSVKDFEASIRAPIGDTFVPQTAFRRHIKPAIITKKGEIIKPMDDQVLVKNKFTKKGKVVKC